ncbi:hypothetical protein [Shewanella nanhaiensis]|uniref:Uncharacterized protein n=1 Tax=Shewanella nanhaiensis TaxID=2864872 RepID=A0ABS7E3M6_9GAMM|nr:hypothetical protein [Shewanella nanhaiensis]MBW8184284.1 hypothetical protein [Shewanella nanhaiensis]
MRTLTIVFCSIMSLLQCAVAGNIWCTGTVSNVYIAADNSVVIKGSWRNDYTRICSTDGSTGIDTVTCSLWFSIISTAMTNDKQVKLMYSDRDGQFQCNNLPTYYSTHNPSYVMLER